MRGWILQSRHTASGWGTPREEHQWSPYKAASPSAQRAIVIATKRTPSIIRTATQRASKTCADALGMTVSPPRGDSRQECSDRRFSVASREWTGGEAIAWSAACQAAAGGRWRSRDFRSVDDQSRMPSEPVTVPGRLAQCQDVFSGERYAPFRRASISVGVTAMAGTIASKGRLTCLENIAGSKSAYARRVGWSRFPYPLEAVCRRQS